MGLSCQTRRAKRSRRRTTDRGPRRSRRRRGTIRGRMAIGHRPRAGARRSGCVPTPRPRAWRPRAPRSRSRRRLRRTRTPGTSRYRSGAYGRAHQGRDPVAADVADEERHQEASQAGETAEQQDHGARDVEAVFAGQTADEPAHVTADVGARPRRGGTARPCDRRERAGLRLTGDPAEVEDSLAAVGPGDRNAHSLRPDRADGLNSVVSVAVNSKDTRFGIGPDRERGPYVLAHAVL